MATRPLSARAARVLGGALAVAFVFVGGFAASPALASADEIGISARPASAEGPDGRTRFSYQVEPGQQVQDNFYVANTGSTAQVFTIAATDAFNGDEGEFALLPTADAPEHVGQWVAFQDGANRIEFTLAPGESRILPFTLTLPAEATPGDHVGGLVASVVTPGAQVTLDRRVATRLYARVAGQLQPRLTISAMDAGYSGDWWNLLSGTVTLRYTVDNPGNVALAGNLTPGVATWFGIPVASPPAGKIEEILPGNASSYELEIPAIAQWGYLNPHVTIDPFVESPDVADQLPAAPVARGAVLIAIPWIVVIGLVIAAAIVGGLWWRRRQDERRAREWMAYTEEQARHAAREEALVGQGVSRE